MHGAHEFLAALATVLCVAALTTVVFQRLHQPVVLGYLLAGLVVGPHVPIPLVADRGVVQTLSELGVIFLMFSLGLEFSLRQLVRVGPTAGLTAVLQCSVMLWLGYAVAQAFGWTAREGLFTGALIAISSTTIIAKAFDEQRVGGALRGLVVGILIVEDLIAVLLMAALTALSAGDGLSAATLLRSGGRLLGLLAAFVALGLLVVPRAVRAVRRLDRPETTLVASIGICFAAALLAQELGYSVALGAFLAGSLVAESGEGEHVEHLIRPVRDLFAAIFFVSVGMLIDPALIARHAAAVAVLTALVIVGKIASVFVGAFLTGNGIRTSVRAGMSLAQIGEFSFIIAALGLSLGATREFLYPVAVAVAAITTLTTPWLIRASGPVASFVDRKLPARLQTFAVLYGSWLERLRRAPEQRSAGSGVRRLGRLLALDSALLLALAIGFALGGDGLSQALVQGLGLGEELAGALATAGALALGAPLLVGVFRLSRRIGVELARAALPEAAPGGPDLSAAPRRVFVLTLQLAVVLAVSLPLLAVAQLFLPSLPLVLVLAAGLLVLGLGFWRSTTELEGHVRAGAAAIIEALAAQARSGSSPGPRALAQVGELLPGLGAPVPVALEPASPAVGRTLAQLDLRGLTGATVLAITRRAGAVLVPTASETLEPGDVLALAGTEEAIEAAQALLRGSEAAPR
jgi:CPA2 family monovalent cation:H+ antiporter-2